MADSGFPILDSTWKRLVVASVAAVQAGWAQEGVFATGVGLDYWKQKRRLLYVGKSLGPAAHRVGITIDQVRSAEASKRWMEQKENNGARYWQFIQNIDPDRSRIAWTNISKIDRVPPLPDDVTGKKKKHYPPNMGQFKQIAAPSLQALSDEFDILTPHVTLFVAGKYCDDFVSSFLDTRGFTADRLPFKDRWTRCLAKGDRFVVRTRHPDRWNDRDEVNQVLNFVNEVLS